MNSAYPICDYVTLFGGIPNVDVSPITKFNISQAAYNSNAKADYCLISLADASLDNSSEEEPIAICLVTPSAQNNQSENVVLGCLAITATSGTTVYHHQFTPNEVKYLIPARPSEIRIRGLSTQTQTDIPLSVGYVTLKFEYLSTEQVNALNSQTNYMTF
tara:strand:- start:609 stop:1088 length:480 start_codon:yes stop_codon:yes gene_type:complete